MRLPSSKTNRSYRFTLLLYDFEIDISLLSASVCSFGVKDCRSFRGLCRISIRMTMVSRRILEPEGKRRAQSADRSKVLNFPSSLVSLLPSYLTKPLLNVSSIITSTRSELSIFVLQLMRTVASVARACGSLGNRKEMPFWWMFSKPIVSVQQDGADVAEGRLALHLRIVEGVAALSLPLHQESNRLQKLLKGDRSAVGSQLRRQRPCPRALRLMTTHPL